MADIFEDHPDLEAPRQRLWKLIEETPHLVWMLTTKRAQNIAKMLPEHWLTVPRHNVMLMVTVESQAYDWRIDKMLEVPAVCYAVSAEPLLGPLDLRKYLQGERRVDWVIAGGESGYAEARPTRTEWFRDLRDHAEAAGAIFHFKQHGAWIAVDPPITNDKGVRYIVCPDDALREADYLLEAGRLRNEGTEWFYRTSEGVKWKDNLLDGKQHLGRPEWLRY
jgi:protein gp37